MNDIHTEIVRMALAQHLASDPETITTTDRLYEDLGLDPLDLVLVVLRLEEIEKAEFPVADLESVVTVDDLAEVVRGWSRIEARATLPAPPPPAPLPLPARTQSGIRPVAAAFAPSLRLASR